MSENNQTETLRMKVVTYLTWAFAATAVVAGIAVLAVGEPKFAEWVVNGMSLLFGGYLVGVLVYAVLTDPNGRTRDQPHGTTRRETPPDRSRAP